MLGDDCNANNIPDACEIRDGLMADCNQDGIPDECQCFWDNGVAPANPTSPTASSPTWAAARRGAMAADDFYLCQDEFHKLNSFLGPDDHQL